MGLFDVFKKKECSICGGEIGLLGNRKLEDGNMCKTCAAKLSPWFSDRRNSTVAEINEQLAYREANREKVSAFHTTLTLGEDTKILIDEDARLFMVTDARDLAEEIPDVLALSDITGCDLDIDEDRDEVKRKGPDGTEVSYNPPRYDYSYDFYITIHVRNPYFDEMRFRLNDTSVEIDNSRIPVLPRTGVGFAPGRTNALKAPWSPDMDADYRRYKAMGEEIRDILLDARRQVRAEAAAAAAPKAAVTCPYCGATTTPDAAGCCEYCGGAVNA